MGLVVILKALWLGMVLFIFRPSSFPIGMLLSIVTWGLSIVSLALFINSIPRAALGLAYIAAFTSVAVFWTGGGSFEPSELLYRCAPDLIFLIAAHLAAKGVERQVTT